MNKADKKAGLLKSIPQIDRLLMHPELVDLRAKFPYIMLRFAREATDEVRSAILAGEKLNDVEGTVVRLVKIKLNEFLSPRLKNVINGTGIILHTGLGRAPLSRFAQENLQKIADGYCNLEYYLESGKRGDRLTNVNDIICELTGAQASAVVNNNAAAVLLTLNSLAYRKEVIVSRGELVEIGGAFRIPEVMKKSGAKLTEVGTTNRTRIEDYKDAITTRTGAILKVHTSNYKILGFTEEVEIKELVDLAHQHNLPLISDLGGGVLVDLRDYGLPYEPVAHEHISAGVDLVTFSGDKVLGGPQCGIIAGRKEAVNKCRKNHLMRALRVDKLILSALEATLKGYLSPGELIQENPTFRMLTEPEESVKLQAERFLTRLLAIKPDWLVNAEVKPSYAQAGSGALPLEKIPSYAVHIKSRDSVENFARKLRTANPPIIGTVQNDELVLDFRTIREDELSLVLSELQFSV